jgi:hypothetical protein
MVDEKKVLEMYREALGRIWSATKLNTDDLSPADAVEIRCYVRDAIKRADGLNPYNEFNPASEAAMRWMENRLGLRVQTQEELSDLLKTQRELIRTEGADGIKRYADYFARLLKED